ncbi:MAG: NAD-glutamate dehydrogenase [Alphaproteobacteria bacterium]
MIKKLVESKDFRQANKKFIEKIIDKVENETTEGLWLKRFIKEFYLCSTPEITLNKDIDYLYKAALSCFNFFKTRKLNEATLRIYHSDEISGAYECKYSIIEIVNDDMPFLLDSTKEILNQFELKIHEIIHPVVKIERTDDNNIKNILLMNDGTSGKYESVMQIYINSIRDPEILKSLEVKLYNSLNDVRLVVNDWKHMLAKLQTSTANIANINDKNFNKQELVNFLNWLAKDNFTFLGYSKYEFNKSNILIKGSDEKDAFLGILNSKNINIKELLKIETSKLTSKNYELINDNSYFHIGKLDIISSVHRSTNLEYICIKTLNENAELSSAEFFIGLFTSALTYQTVNHIPIIREKVEYIIDNSGFLPVSYSRKELLSILESLPKEELFQLNKETLLTLSLNIYDLIIKPKLKLFARQDILNNFVSCMVFIPRERFSSEISEKIRELLQKDLGGLSTIKTVQVSNLPLAYLYLIINTKTADINDKKLEEIESKLRALTNLWNDDLKDSIFSSFQAEEAETLFYNYKSAFPGAYKERPEAHESATQDIYYIEKSIKNKNILFKIQKLNEKNNVILKVYSTKNKIILSEIMPILDNMGFKVIDESTFCIKPKNITNEVWVQEFHLTISAYENLTISEIKEYENFNIEDVQEFIEEALEKIWHGQMQNDALNKLIPIAGLAWRETVLVRALTKYIRQAGLPYSHNYLEEVITKHPKLAKNLVDLFFTYFDPLKAAQNIRKKLITELTKKIIAKLNKIQSSAEDKVLRRLLDVIKAITRTNYFQLNNEQTYKDYISFKFDSAKIPELPLPRPYAEIFVYSPRVEGIHLRGGKVARGGLRWSDRSEDFRTEVLGLMKAQMTKNSVIVPVGSKGGFVVKNSITALGREEYLKEGKECYKTFLRGLLDITDNIVKGKILPPKDVVRYDDEDPYLVVAADKGTATFSDIANSISQEYNFWLGDAFASGGSVGYDHKKMGITAKGAWISVVRHFREINIDIQATDFTVVGIGDMSGDVFGNGLLLSKHICLVGAFNHLHIFIDPNPDSALSFDERKRLFNLSGSNWTDYNSKLISEGGGVFERTAKSISISKQMKERFNIEENELTPDQLIKKLLCAKVDLLWNGGIGTYVKAIDESHTDVGDKTNDNVRVNGSDLNCSVVGEGGNLGFSQKGRIEYALAGGRLNTDAIDNSAGVDCSDHEVNIKIAFGKVIEASKLSLDDRNKLLEEMTEEVAALVLRDNQLQTQAITIMEKQGHEVLEMHERLINRLESIGTLNREVEFLPSKTELARRNIAKLGLTRPEIAVLLAYSKLTIYNDLISSDLPDDPYFQNDLSRYFPKPMRESWQEEINHHPLKREIIATSVTNSMVNRIGNFFYHFALEDTGLKGSDIARAYTITREVFNLREIWESIESLDGKMLVDNQVELFFQINKLVQRCIFWFLRNSPQLIEVTGIVNSFKPGIKELFSIIEKLITGSTKNKFQERLKNYKLMSIQSELAHTIARISILSSGCDIVSVAVKNNLSIETVGKIYYKVGTRFKFDFLSSAIDNIKVESYWQRLALKTLKDELYDQQRILTSKIIKFVGKDNDPIEDWCKMHESEIERYDHFINDLFIYEILDYSMVTLAVKRTYLLVG